MPRPLDQNSELKAFLVCLSFICCL